MKPQLDYLYRDWYSQVKSRLSCSGGKILELGSGPGFIKKYIPDVITSDVRDLPDFDIDLVLDAKNIGTMFAGSLSNIIMINVFHHVNNSTEFLDSVESSLVKGGRVIMVEPSNNLWSRSIYKLHAHEPFNTNQEGWNFISNDPMMDSNQAQSWIVFKRDYNKFSDLYPNLRVIEWANLMPITYLLTGGHTIQMPFSTSFVRFVRSLERRFFDKAHGMFSIIVIEKYED